MGHRKKGQLKRKEKLCKKEETEKQILGTKNMCASRPNHFQVVNHETSKLVHFDNKLFTNISEWEGEGGGAGIDRDLFVAKGNGVRRKVPAHFGPKEKN